MHSAAGAVLLALSFWISRISAYTYAQLNYTSSPSQGFVGSFAGPLYTAGTTAPSCSVLISPGQGTETFIVAPNVNYKDAACTNLSALAFGEYFYLDTEPVKCTAPGEGYMYNYPANVAGAPPTVGGQYICAKLKDYGNTINRVSWL
ncbi:hypothetical protein WJX82_005684 [Trebouxia sp. C0006]